MPGAEPPLTPPLVRRSDVSRRFLVGYGVCAVALLGLGALGAYVLLPRLVRSAYEGTSFEILNGLIRGQGDFPVEYYLDRVARLARLAMAALLAGLVAGLALWTYRGPVKRLHGALCRSQPAGSALQVTAVAAVLGISFGALESVAAWIRFRAEGHMSAGNNPDTLWMAPVVIGTLFALLAVALHAALGGWRRGLSYRVVVAACVALGVYGTLRGLRLGFHPWAVWLLAIALGVQTARGLDRRPAALRFLRRAALPAAAGLALGIGGILVGDRILHDRRLAALPAPDPGAPNVLLLVLDTVRGESLGLYGYGRPTTPEIGRRAVEGVVFDRAIASSPWTLPTHATLFTGRWDHELSTDWVTPLDGEFPTLAEFLAARGYRTAGFVANQGNAAETTGLGRGFAHYVDHPRSWDGWLVSAFIPRRVSRWLWPKLDPRWKTLGRRYAPQITEEFLTWLDRSGERPFFAFLNYFDAHGPYEIHAEYLERFPDTPPDTLVPGKDGTWRKIPRELRLAIDGYDSSIALVDAYVGRLLRRLEARGALDNTIVVITSDHGEHLGDRGLMDHGNSLYAQLLCVPLVIRFPGGVPAGRRVAASVSLRDVPATIVDLAGFEGAPFPGRSLVRHWEADAPLTPEPILAEVSAAPFQEFYEGPADLGEMKAVVLGSLHYILNGDGSEELYDLSLDPRGLTDLADSEGGREALPRLRRALQDLLADAPGTDARAEGRPEVRTSLVAGRRDP